MCNIGDCVMADLYRESTPKARKQHVCCECGATIDPGETYQRVEGMWDGRFYTFKTCDFCAQVRLKAEHDVNGYGYHGVPFTELWECMGMDYADTDQSTY
jgi:hypothetical protein